jgi:hypothetical protein
VLVGHAASADDSDPQLRLCQDEDRTTTDSVSPATAEHRRHHDQRGFRPSWS